MNRIFKWDVPVDDREHIIGGGSVIHVECQYSSSIVQVWTEENDEYATDSRRAVRIVGTGHLYSDDWMALGTAVTSLGGSSLVWHLIVQKLPRGVSGD